MEQPEVTQGDEILEYLHKRLVPLGITDKYNQIVVNEHDQTFPLFRRGPEGISIRYAKVNGLGYQTYVEGNKGITKPIERTRYHPRLERRPDGTRQKYHTPKGAPSPIFIGATLLKALRSGSRIPVLFLVEGEFKAAVLDRLGLPIVGICGVWNDAKKIKKGKQEQEDDYFTTDLIELIDSLAAKRIVKIYDSDLFDIARGAESGHIASTRPLGMAKSAARFVTICNEKKVDPWMAWVEPGEEKLGLDDWLIKEIGPAPEILQSLEKIDVPDETMLRGIGDNATPRARKIADALGWSLDHISGTEYEKPDAGPSVGIRDIYPAIKWLREGRKIVAGLLNKIGGNDSEFRGMNFASLDNKTKVFRIWALDNVNSFAARHKVKMADWTGFRFMGKEYRKEGDDVFEVNVIRTVNLKVENGETFAIRNDGYYQLIAEFGWSLRWHLCFSSHETSFMVDIADKQGKIHTALMPTDSVISKDKFNKQLVNLNLPVWVGSEQELQHMYNRLCRDIPSARAISTLGWDEKTSAWFWANGVYFDGKVQQPDADGLIEIAKETVMLPIASSIFADNTDYNEERKVRHIESHFEWSNWLDAARLAYGYSKALTGAAFVAASVFSDIARSARSKFPLLFLFGRPGQGKSSYAKSLQSFFGTPMEEITLGNGNTTIAGLTRSLARFRNVPVFLDEVSSTTVKPELMMILKDFYGGAGASQGTKNGPQSMHQYKLTSTVICASQHLPSFDGKALVRRCVVVAFDHAKDLPGTTKESRASNLISLQAMEQTGLTCLVHRMLKHRDKVKNRFAATLISIQAKLGRIAAEREIPAEDGVIEAHAIFVTPIMILAEEIGLKDWEDAILESVLELLPLHAEASESSSEIGVFWFYLQRAKNHGRLLIDKEYRISDDEKQIFFQISQCWGAYASELRMVEPKAVPIPLATITNYLRSSDGFVEGRKARLKLYKDNTTSVFVFELDKIPFDPFSSELS